MCQNRGPVYLIKLNHQPYQSVGPCHPDLMWPCSSNMLQLCIGITGGHAFRWNTTWLWGTWWHLMAPDGTWLVPTFRTSWLDRDPQATILRKSRDGRSSRRMLGPRSSPGRCWDGRRTWGTPHPGKKKRKQNRTGTGTGIGLDLGDYVGTWDQIWLWLGT